MKSKAFFFPALILLIAIVMMSFPQERRVNVVKKERRTALVIGNKDYSQGELANAINDSQLIRSTLEKLGFEIIYSENANLRTMKNKLWEFGDKLGKYGGVGLFYFSGHGMQIDGKNYLLPLGANIKDEADVEFECFHVDRVIAKMGLANNRLNIVILDACRDNPFVRTFSRSFTRGLALMQSGEGLLIAYATSPGKTASDGPGKNGLFTQHLVNTLEIPGLSLGEVFKMTREKVYEASGKKQLPWEINSVVGDFFFKPETPKASYGFLKVTAIPYAELIIDGNEMGIVPPIKFLKLKTGQHQVILKKDREIVKYVTIESDKTLEFYHSFAKQE